jgi:hypothetical protein
VCVWQQRVGTQQQQQQQRRQQRSEHEVVVLRVGPAIWCACATPAAVVRVWGCPDREGQGRVACWHSPRAAPHAPGVNECTAHLDGCR